MEKESLNKKVKYIRRMASIHRSFAGSGEPGQENLDSLTELDENGNTMKEVKYSEDATVEEINSYTYDSNNLLIEHAIEYVPDETSERRVIVRNNEGRILNESKFYGDLAGERTEYSYDDAGNVTGIKYFDEEGDFSTSEEIVYDSNKNIASRAVLDKDGKKKERREFVFSDDRSSVEERLYDGQDRLQKTVTVKLNSQHKEESSLERTGQGKIITAVYSNYDDKGRLVEKRYKDYFSKILRMTYDEQDHMLTEEVVDEHGMLLRKHVYEYDTAGKLSAEQNYEMDMTRGGRDKHFTIRFEYEYYD